MRLKCIFHGFLALSVTASLRHAQSQPVTFDWFEYSGTNAIETKIAAGEYQNPILSRFYPDSSICREVRNFISSIPRSPIFPAFRFSRVMIWSTGSNWAMKFIFPINCLTIVKAYPSFAGSGLR
jgi:hypothetical protein